MNTMSTTPNSPPIEALIAAAGMTCYAPDCDTIVIRRAPHLPPAFEPAIEVVPPFPGD
jgi:hypothetical protein